MIGIGVPISNLRMLCQEDTVGGEFQGGARLLGKASFRSTRSAEGSMARIASQASVAEAIISLRAASTRAAGSPSA